MCNSLLHDTITSALIPCVSHINTISPPKVVTQLTKPNKDLSEDVPFLPASWSFGNWVKTLPVWADGDGAACVIFLVGGGWFCSTMMASMHVTFLFEGVVEASLPP
jgi:hypothetical protein